MLSNEKPWASLEKDERQVRIHWCCTKTLQFTCFNVCRNLIQDHLATIFMGTTHSDEREQLACAKAFGTCALKHRSSVLNKLELLLKTGVQKKSSSFFGLLRDNKLEESQTQLRCTILYCVGQSAVLGDGTESSGIDEIIQKFVMPALKSQNTCLKISALRALADIARSVQPRKGKL